MVFGCTFLYFVSTCSSYPGFSLGGNTSRPIREANLLRMLMTIKHHDPYIPHMGPNNTNAVTSFFFRLSDFGTKKKRAVFLSMKTAKMDLDVEISVDLPYSFYTDFEVKMIDVCFLEGKVKNVKMIP